jgi:lysophospholipase L1-like esterase
MHRTLVDGRRTAQTGRRPWNAVLAVVLGVSCLMTRPVTGDDPPRGPERFEESIVAFEQQDRKSPPQPGGILFVGSSSIRLWDLEGSFPGLGAVNRGFGGSEVADSVHYFDRIVAPHRPRVVVLYAGDNDISKGKTPCQVHEDFLQFVSLVRAANPQAKIVYISIKPSLKRWNLVHRMRAANALIRATCLDEKGLEFVDVEPAMLGPDGQPRPELFVEDGLHLSAAGYREWAQLVGPHLE